MKQLTPIEELIDELMVGELSQKISNYNRMTIIGWINKNKLLEKEKQVIVDAYVSGFSKGKWDVSDKKPNEHGEQFYNNKYSK